MTIVIVTAGLVGLVVRLWLVFHSPSTSDEDMVGLLAQGALHGHVQAFYGGQQYGGTAEPYLVALAFAVFGQSAVVAKLVVLALAAGSAVLVWRITLRLAPSPAIALLAGAVTWCAPGVAVRDSVQVYGFRGVTLVCGLTALLLSLRIYDDEGSWIDFAGIGAVAGVGWWSSPEIAYFAMPVVVILVMALARTDRNRLLAWWKPLAVLAGAFAIGALPWIWANVGSGFASLSTVSAGGPKAMDFGGRWSLLFHHVLPMEAGLARIDDGAALLGWAHAALLVGSALAVGGALVLCLLRGGPSLAVATGVIAFPFLYALSPASWTWQDGRYANYLPPLVAMVLAVGCSELTRHLGRMRTAATWLMAAVVSVSLIVSIVGIRAVVASEPASFTSSWGNPDEAGQAVVSKLEGADIRTGYADYWVAYKLDFLARGRLAITTAGNEVDRSPTIEATVAQSRDPAWIFVPPSAATRNGTEFTKPKQGMGPDTVTEGRFTATLQRLGVSYRVIDVGLARAVVPSRAVTPFEAGLPGAHPG